MIGGGNSFECLGRGHETNDKSDHTDVDSPQEYPVGKGGFTRRHGHAERQAFLPTAPSQPKSV
jgi:hypothetical protein